MITVNYQGRLGNRMIQYFVGKYFSTIFKLKFNYHPISNTKSWVEFDKPIENFKNFGTRLKYVTDDNFIELIQREPEFDTHYIFHGYFQKKLFFEEHQENIKNLMNISYNYVDPNDLFIHYRIGDIINQRQMLPIEYYEEWISKINFKNGFISSDTIDHPFCKKLIDKYNLTPTNTYDPLETIFFAKNFKNIILSEGTFSWWIGFLSQNANIFCNKRDWFWHGDIFFNNWNFISWDYDLNFIKNRLHLLDYKPVRVKL